MTIEVVKYSPLKNPEKNFYKVLVNGTYDETFISEKEAIDYAERLFKNNGNYIVNEEIIKTFTDAN